MNIKTIEGHLTSTEKRAILHLLQRGMREGHIGKKDYYITEEGNTYAVKILQMDRGLIPCAGSKLRTSVYIHRFEVAMD